jgi:DNA-binding MarR family transcriptional regulator
MQTNLRTTFQLLLRRYGSLSETCCENCCDSDMTLMQSNIMHEIMRQHNPSMQEIAYALGIDITTFSRQVKSLVEKGLVKKTPVAQDNRIQILSLTQEGERLNKDMDQQVNSHLEQVLSQFSEFERQSVVNALQLLDKAMLQSSVCCPPPKDVRR